MVELPGGKKGIIVTDFTVTKDAVRKLVYTPRKKPEREKDHHRNPENAADVMGATRFVYLDENAGKTVAPYMSQQLEMGSDLI